MNIDAMYEAVAELEANAAKLRAELEELDRSTEHARRIVDGVQALAHTLVERVH